MKKYVIGQELSEIKGAAEKESTILLLFTSEEMDRKAAAAKAFATCRCCGMPACVKLRSGRNACAERLSRHGSYDRIKKSHSVI